MSWHGRFLEKYGLRLRIITLISALTVVLVFLIGVVVLKIAEHNFMKLKINSGQLVLAGIQANIDSFWRDRTDLVANPEDVDRLSRLITDLGRNQGLVDLILVDAEMRIIATEDLSRLGKVVEDESLRRALMSGKFRHAYSGRDLAFGIDVYDRIDFAGPIFRDGEIVALANYSMPLDDVTSALAGTLDVLYLYTFLDVILVLLIGGFLLMYFVIHPLNELRRATEQIMQGELSHPVQLRSRDEMGLIAKALETLRKTLAEKNLTVNEQMKSLETLNRRLTRIRDQLIHTDRLAYLGRVSAGVAHEIGNPLGAIFGYLEILRTSDDDPAVRHEMVNRIGAEIERIDFIMKELLNFSRPQREEKRLVRLGDLIRECTEILKAQRLLDRVAVEVIDGAETPPIMARPGQLKQVFINLIVNAVDAMDGEGSVEIRISHMEYDKMVAYAPMLDQEPGLETGETAFTDTEKRGIVFSSRMPYAEGESVVTVAVRDHGPGIDPQNLNSIFEPFFTTKEKSKGTGLGLSICQRIVEGMGGVLRVQSKPGQGAVFTCFFLPDRIDRETDEDTTE